jgi:hypothetical protein
MFLDDIRAAWWEQAHTLLERGALTEVQKDKLEADLNCCLALDHFDFAMAVQRHNELLVMDAVVEAN